MIIASFHCVSTSSNVAYGDVVHREFSIYDSDSGSIYYDDNVPHDMKVEHTPSPVEPSPPAEEENLYVK